MKTHPKLRGKLYETRGHLIRAKKALSEAYAIADDTLEKVSNPMQFLKDEDLLESMLEIDKLIDGLKKE